jgi:hypothetical protein
MAQTPFNPPISTSTSLTTTNPLGPIHISCDGLVDDLFNPPTKAFKVFAWDGANPGWGYEYNGAVSSPTRSYALSSKIHEPEVALVSDVNFIHIYVLLIYVDGSNSVFYEFYKWDGILLTFPATPTITGTLGTSSYLDGETAIAGDRYNHFAMACDQGFNVSTNILQQIGYVDPATGNITLGAIGNVNYGGTLNVSQPDIDITYDGDARVPYDAVVAITFSYDNSSRIISNSIDMSTLFAGTTWNTTTGDVVVNVSSLGGQVDHPAISLNDGYRAWLYCISSTPQGIAPIHYGVAYHDFDASNSIIYQYPVTLQNSWSLWSPYQVGASTTAFTLTNNTDLIPENNNYPDIVVQPQEVQMIVAWNFINLTSGGFFSPTPLEAIANSFGYPFQWSLPATYTAPCFVTTPTEMLFNLTANQTPEMAISNFSEGELLYFYYDNNTNELLYKTRPFWATALRKGISNTNKNLSFFPNPVSTQIQLLNFNAEENYHLEVYTMTGSLVTAANGLSTQLETIVNEQLPKLNTGLYLLKVKGENGIEQTLKLAKQ